MLIDTTRYPRVASVADRLGYAFLLFLSLAVSMSYLPFMANWQLAGIAGERLWHYLIMGVFVALILLSFFTGKTVSTTMFKTMAVLVALLLLDWLVLETFFPDSLFGGEVRMALIPLCALWIGCRMRMDNRRMSFLIMVFTLGIVAVGLTVVFMQGSGFRITKEYFAEQKNAIGPMLATAAVICMGYVLNMKSRKPLSIAMSLLALLIVALCVLLILTIRARAALLVVALVLSLLLFQRFRGQYLLLSLWCTALLLVALFLLLPNTVEQYVNQSLFAGFSSGDISSGRVERNYMAMSVIAQNPLFGHLLNPTAVDVVHNFPLWQSYKYGLLGALPILSIYFYLLILSLKNVFTIGAQSLLNIGAYVMLVSLGISMFEYTFPFGPGTTSVMPFFLLGVALRASNDHVMVESQVYCLNN